MTEFEINIGLYSCVLQPLDRLLITSASSAILHENHEVVSKMFGIRPMSFDSFKIELGRLVFSDSIAKKKLEDFMLPKIDTEIKLLQGLQ